MPLVRHNGTVMFLRSDMRLEPVDKLGNPFHDRFGHFASRNDGGLALAATRRAHDTDMASDLSSPEAQNDRSVTHSLAYRSHLRAAQSSSGKTKAYHLQAAAAHDLSYQRHSGAAAAHLHAAEAAEAIGRHDLATLHRGMHQRYTSAGFQSGYAARD